MFKRVLCLFTFLFVWFITDELPFTLSSFLSKSFQKDSTLDVLPPNNIIKSHHLPPSILPPIKSVSFVVLVFGTSTYLGLYESLPSLTGDSRPVRVDLLCHIPLTLLHPNLSHRPGSLVTIHSGRSRTLVTLPICPPLWVYPYPERRTDR